MTELEQPPGKAKLDAMAEADRLKGLADHGEVLSIKDRLLARTRRKVYRFLIVDKEDEIPIDTRRMASSEREQAIIHYNKIKNLKKDEDADLTVINEAIKALQLILNSICLNKELDFTSGEEWITDDLVVGLTNLAITTSWEDSGAEIKSFRPDVDGSNIA